MVNRPKKVLVIAYACEPDKTSEPGVGWYFSKEIASFYDTLVLTRKNNRAAIESKPRDDRKYIYYDLPGVFKFLKKTLPLGTQFYYAIWQWGAYFYAKRYLKKSKTQVHLAHHLNFGVSWIAPPAFLLRQRFVWGPIGGGDNVPWRFLKRMGLKSKIQEIIYHSINQLGKISPFSYMTRIKCDAVLFRTKSAEYALRLLGQTSAYTVSETATNDLKERTPKKASKTVHAIAVGRMSYWKGFIFAVEGFHYFLKNGGEGILELFGEGTEMEEIASYIKKHQLEQQVFIRGFVPNVVIKQKMEEANIMLHPSFREGGSWAIMEAMSYGLPVICLNTSGPKDMVTESCGVLIDLGSVEQVSNDIGKGIATLAADKNLYETLSQNAITRIKMEYNWDRRGQQIREVYEKVLS